MQVHIETIVRGAGARDFVGFAVDQEGRPVQIIETDSRRIVIVYDAAEQAEEVGISAIYAGRSIVLAQRQAAAKVGGGLVGADGLPVPKA